MNIQNTKNTHHRKYITVRLYNKEEGEDKETNAYYTQFNKYKIPKYRIKKILDKEKLSIY